MKRKYIRGFTMIELLITMALIAILATVVVFLINPAQMLARARDTQRQSDLVAILSSIYQYSAEHSGALPDTDGDPLTSNFPNSPTCIGTGVGCYDLGSAGDAGETMVPVYMAAMPMDPRTGTSANTGYLIYIDANDRLVASASGETREINLTR
ncbi:type II secretion system protein [Candidatus Woesebacteria bacterium]|nr:type II secretion system protein [Candidatus Woesebacteria bacterium]